MTLVLTCYKCIPKLYKEAFEDILWNSLKFYFFFMSTVVFLAKNFNIFLILSGIVLSLLYEERICDMKPSHYINWQGSWVYCWFDILQSIVSLSIPLSADFLVSR